MQRAALVLERMLSQIGLGERIQRILTFGAVGGVAASTHFGVALAANTLLGAPPLTANVIGYCAAVMVSYLGHAYLTFRRPIADGRQFLRFIAISLAGLVLGQVLTFIATSLLALPFVVALALVVTLVPAFTYFAASLWGFVAPAQRSSAPRIELNAPVGSRRRDCGDPL